MVAFIFLVGLFFNFAQAADVSKELNALYECQAWRIIRREDHPKAFIELPTWQRNYCDNGICVFPVYQPEEKNIHGQRGVYHIFLSEYAYSAKSVNLVSEYALDSGFRNIYLSQFSAESRFKDYFWVFQLSSYGFNYYYKDDLEDRNGVKEILSSYGVEGSVVKPFSEPFLVSKAAVVSEKYLVQLEKYSKTYLSALSGFCGEYCEEAIRWRQYEQERDKVYREELPEETARSKAGNEYFSFRDAITEDLKKIFPGENVYFYVTQDSNNEDMPVIEFSREVFDTDGSSNYKSYVLPEKDWPKGIRERVNEALKKRKHRDETDEAYSEALTKIFANLRVKYRIKSDEVVLSYADPADLMKRLTECNQNVSGLPKLEGLKKVIEDQMKVVEPFAKKLEKALAK